MMLYEVEECIDYINDLIKLKDYTDTEVYKIPVFLKNDRFIRTGKIWSAFKPLKKKK